MTKQHKKFLDNLFKSLPMTMHSAVSFVADQFNLSKDEAEEIIIKYVRQ
jgi:hypothetical protein